MLTPIEDEKMPNQKFCFACGAQIDSRAEVCPKCGVRQHDIKAVGQKNRLAAALFAFFLGWLGIHKFYLGRIGWGIVYILFMWTGIPWIIAIIEGIIYICSNDEKFAQKYG